MPRGQKSPAAWPTTPLPRPVCCAASHRPSSRNCSAIAQSRRWCTATTWCLLRVPDRGPALHSPDFPSPAFFMTYCVAIKLNAGLVFLSDSRTNAGLDQISSFRKMIVYEQTGDRFMVLLSAGNLSISQSVREILQIEQIEDGAESGEPITIWNAKSMFDAARVLGAAVRHVYERDGAALKRSGVDFNVSMLFCAQIKVEATSETPYFQVGESKYGKPVLDRVLTPETPLKEAAKCALVSMDSTLKSNLSVGLSLVLGVYEVVRLAPDKLICSDENNPYFRMVHDTWGQKLRQVFDSIEDPAWNGGSTQVPLMVSTGRNKPLRKITNHQDRLI